MLRAPGPIRPTPGVCATEDAARDEKHLINWQDQAILLLDGRPLGECRLRGVYAPRFVTGACGFLFAMEIAGILAVKELMT